MERARPWPDCPTARPSSGAGGTKDQNSQGSRFIGGGSKCKNRQAALIKVWGGMVFPFMLAVCSPTCVRGRSPGGQASASTNGEHGGLAHAAPVPRIMVTLPPGRLPVVPVTESMHEHRGDV